MVSRPAGQQEQQHEAAGKGIGHRLDHVAEHGQRLLGHLAEVEPGGVHLRHGLGPAHGQHHGRRVVDLLTDDLARVLERVEHRVLPDDVGCGCRRRWQCCS